MEFQSFESMDDLEQELKNKRSETIAHCPICGADIRINDFRNHISIQEFKITGLCQNCQDDVFGKD